MSAVNIPKVMQAAIQHIQAGRLQPAQTLCQQVLNINPTEVNALHLLGVIAHRAGQHDRAIELIRKAISINSRVADFHNNLGTALQAKGEHDKAAKCFKLALKLAPDHAMARNNLGNTLLEQDLPDQAIKQYKRSLALQPGYAVAHYNLGNALQNQGQPDEAKASYEQALKLKPNYTEAHTRLGYLVQTEGDFETALAHFNHAVLIDPGYADAHGYIGQLYMEQGRLDEATVSCKQALTLQPDNIMFLNSLGNIFQKQHRLDEAIDYFGQALALAPDNADIHINFGSTQFLLGLYDKSIDHFEQAINARPDFAMAHSYLGRSLTRLGQLNEAVAQLNKALELDPSLNDTNSNLLFTLNYAPGYNAAEIYAEHQKFAERYELPLAPLIAPHLNDCTPGRPLRIGYLSPDFRNHPVAYFIEPVLAHHDSEKFEVFCYSNNLRVDDVTQRLQTYVQHWRAIDSMSDEQAAKQICEDGIDILVDLAGHTGNNRMRLFARKPAPVQVTWLGYLNTTGLNAMDYRITDAFANPPGLTDQYHSETLVRMPDSQWCYQPPKDCPAVAALPALSADKVTLGSLHNLAKITPEVIRVWAKILNTSPNTRLLMVANVGLGQRKKEITARFVEQGVDAQRLELLENTFPFADYLALHNKIDINLDSFPYTGGTTTCHSLWMGVPVITLSGEAVMSRGGTSLLKAVQLDELIAESEEEYISIAARLSNDLDQLSTLRAELRSRMRKSALTNASLFTKHMEDAYLRMWDTWCNQQSVARQDKSESSTS